MTTTTLQLDQETDFVILNQIGGPQWPTRITLKEVDVDGKTVECVKADGTQGHALRGAGTITLKVEFSEPAR